MSFLNLGAWQWAGLAVLIVLLYLWNFSTTTHETATFFLWQRALKRRPVWVALRFWLSLATQLILLLLLVAALAQPFWTAEARSQRTIVLLMDVSASMSATDAAPSPWEQMQTEARRITEKLQTGEQMAIIGVGSTLRTACRLTDRRETLLAAIDSLAPTDTATNMQQAVDLAKRLLAGKSNPCTIVLTDGAFPGATELAASENVHVTVLRGEGQNVAITRFAARPQVIDPGIHDVLVEVTNFTDQTMKCDLEIGIQDKQKISESLSVPANQSQQVVLPVPIPRGGVLEARLAAADDLAADNRVCALVRSRSRPHVLLVSQAFTVADRPLRAALESDPRWDVSLYTKLPAILPFNPIIVFLRHAPDPLPSCPILVIDPRQSCELWDVDGVINSPDSAVGAVKSESPLLAQVRFQDVVVEQAARLVFKQPAVALVTSSSGDSLYSMIQRPAADTLVLHVNLQKDKSDLVMRPDFPRLINNAIDWLCPDSQSTMFATTADTVAIPGSDEQRRLTTPDGLTHQIQPHQTFVVLDRVGTWTDADGASDLTLPINLLNREESDLRPGAEVPSSQLETAAEVRQPLWMLLVCAALIGLVVQWCLFDRRMVV